MSMIELRNVSKQYGPTTVVDQVSMAVEQGCVTAIVGTSGSGKSTVLRMINRLVPLSAGEIYLNGRNIMTMAPNELRRGMGYAIQGHGLFPHRTVAQNIATVPRLLKWQKAAIQARVHELLELFHLDPATFAPKLPHQLSGGQQQRVGVARALAAQPDVLLMDEPFGALDPVIRSKAQADLLNIQRQFGITVIIVTHDIDEAFWLGDKVGVMNEGRLLQYAAPETILRQPADAFCEQLTGTTDRALKLLSLSAVRDHLQPMRDNLTLTMDAATSLRDALSTMTWHGVTAGYVSEQGVRIGSVDMATILAAGQAQ